MFGTNSHYMMTDPTLTEIFDEHPTLFTPSQNLFGLYWSLLYLWQMVFIFVLWFPRNKEIESSAVHGVHHSFITFNLSHFALIMFLMRGNFVGAAIMSIVNVLVLSHLYVRLFGYPDTLGTNVLVRMPMKLLFGVTLLDVYFLCSVPFHCSTGACRIISYVLIWVFGWATVFKVTYFNDPFFGFALSFIFLAIGFGQLDVKLSEMQPIYAFIISGIVFLLSVSILTQKIIKKRRVKLDAAGDERAPLLSDV